MVTNQQNLQQQSTLQKTNCLQGIKVCIKMYSELFFSHMSQSCIWNWRMWRGGSYGPASWMWRSGGEVMTRLRQKKNVKSRLASILWWKRSGSCYWAWGWDIVCVWFINFPYPHYAGSPVFLLFYLCILISVSDFVHKHNITLQITQVKALKVTFQCCSTEIPICCLVRLDHYSELIQTLG